MTTHLMTVANHMNATSVIEINESISIKYVNPLDADPNHNNVYANYT